MSIKKEKKQVIYLQKSSPPEHVKTYFKKVFELKQTGNEFPVNLDDVWPLVYSRKDDAIRALKNKCVKGFDYQSFSKNAENRKGGRPSSDFQLSIPCLEFLIARQKREVFEVYRQVFHKAIEGGLKAGKVLTDQAGYNEDQVFVTRLGNEVIKGYYAKGMLYFALNQLMQHFGYTGKGGGTYAKKYEGAVLVTRGKQQTWFVSLHWVDELLKRTTLNITAEKVNQVYKELYKTDKRVGEDITYSYRFTDKQMLDLIAYVNRVGKPGLKSEIIDKLMEGRS